MRKNGRNEKAISELNFIFYVLLLILTPFLLLQNYLQAAIGVASNAHFELGSFSIPWVAAIAAALLISLWILLRKIVKMYHVIVCVAILLLFWIGQQITDYYFGHKFYELQHNWHYLAYSGFAIVSWRYFKAKGKNAAEIIRYTFIFAICASTLDEAAQVPLSSRIFDVSDIAKDTYGAVIGNILVFYLLDEGRKMIGKINITHRRVKDYFKDPKTVLIYEYIYAFTFLSIASILSDHKYIPLAFVIPAGIFFLIWLYIHLLQFKIWRKILLGLLVLAVLALGISFIIHKGDNIVYNSYGLTVYKGIPIPFFDVMIYDNGSFRLVDKKHIFTYRDRKTIKKKCTDILIIGSGAYGKGGKGFPEEAPVQFLFNPNTGSMTQVIILQTPAACTVYNRLKEEGKNVTFILHNTC